MNVNNIPTKPLYESSIIQLATAGVVFWFIENLLKSPEIVAIMPLEWAPYVEAIISTMQLLSYALIIYERVVKPVHAKLTV
jgi:hypothetical protein